MTVAVIIRRESSPMRDMRCPDCGKLLFRLDKTVALRNFINVQCSRCKRSVTF